MLAVKGHDNVWALGDCAVFRRQAGASRPSPTAQHATPTARTAAENILARLRGAPLKPLCLRRSR